MRFQPLIPFLDNRTKVREEPDMTFLASGVITKESLAGAMIYEHREKSHN